MTEPLGSFGTLVKIGDAATPTEAFTTIGELGDIDGPSMTLDTHEAPSQTSLVMKRVAGMLKMGAVTFPINFIPTDGTHDDSTGLIADMFARTLRHFQLVWPDAGSTTWAFSAYVAGVHPKGVTNGVLSAEVSLEISGAVTF